MNATPKRKRTAKKPVDPMADAFAIAEVIASAGIREWLIHGHDRSEQRDRDTATIFDALVRSQHGGIDPQDVVNRTLHQYVTEQGPRAEALEASGGLLVTALDAGYLYGLAVGLAFAKMGGAR